MPLLNRHGVYIYYEVHGTGKPLLLTHGYSSSSEMWRAQVKPLSKDFKLIIWDMRGHGKSDYPGDQQAYSEAHTVADMSAILDIVCGRGAMAIVGGLSLGGYMSQAFYHMYPARVTALLIIDTGPGFKKDSARDDWNKYANKTADQFEREGLASLQSQSAERSQVMHRNAKGLALAARGMLAQRDNSVIKSLANIRVPSLIVVGADDTGFIATSEYMALKIPGAEKVVVPDAGHAVNIDNPEGFLKAIRPFLGRLDLPKASL
ncbi:Putative alpha/beta hydrolase-1 [Septoria linicola]|uniref:Alpha/beta hydrolase-1 n=1 Tax=Septoria linicola TaxID=215465 RepID=A0A9Q9ASD1_9PEZI|nr:putative alpha/beta hydrolase-1 [Septoria linicola]USW54544.1 Putative alpha/beta hydrolase-1 [Septoria linicola]